MLESWNILKEKYLIYEDDNILALNKPIGISVVGENKGSDLMSIARDTGEYISFVHRIDKETSGLVLFAKSPKIHAELTRQFATREVEKFYIAMVKGTNLPDQGIIELPLSIGRKNRVRIAGKREDIAFDKEKHKWFLPEGKELVNVKSYPSNTKFQLLSSGKENSEILVQPISGRKNQIRVHLAWIGHRILGDPLFSEKDDIDYRRMMLHSYKIRFKASWIKESFLEIKIEPEFGIILN